MHRRGDLPRRANNGPAAAAGRRPVALFFAAQGGGVQKIQVTMANAFAERNLVVDCVLPQAEGPFLNHLLPQVRVIDLCTRRPLSVVRRLAQYLREVQPAALLASQQHTILAAIWARRLACIAVPLTIAQHNTLSELCRQSRRPHVRLMLPIGARLFFHWANRVVAVSSGVADDLAAVTGIPRDSIEVVYNPIVTPDLAAQARLPSGHPWLDRKDRPVVLGAGNLITAKDFVNLVRAFGRVRVEHSARLVILGEGEQRSNLERWARDLGIAADVDLPGYKPNPFAFMARADVFALTSRFEGFGNVLVEALACGCPVVSTDCRSGPAEILQGGRYGRLVPVGDHEALGDAILAAIRAPADPKELRARASLFSAEQATDRYLDLLGFRTVGGHRTAAAPATDG